VIARYTKYRKPYIYWSNERQTDGFPLIGACEVNSHPALAGQALERSCSPFLFREKSSRTKCIPFCPRDEKNRRFVSITLSSKSGHEKPWPNLEGPPSKAKYILWSIVNKYREGKVKRSPKGKWNRTWNYVRTRSRSQCFALANSKYEARNKKQARSTKLRNRGTLCFKVFSFGFHPPTGGLFRISIFGFQICWCGASGDCVLFVERSSELIYFGKPKTFVGGVVKARLNRPYGIYPCSHMN